MKVLVTGGAGYLGSVLSTQLVMQGHDVTVVCRQGANSLAHLCSYSNFRCMMDMLSEADLRQWDVIIPLAAVVGAAACEHNPEAHRVNVDAIARLCRLASKNQRVLFPSTDCVYGTMKRKSG